MTITNNKLTLKDTVYQQVIEMICNGKLQSNEIITEKQLTSHFGMSKSPVREALIQLCHDHVLTSIPRCGYQVVQINGKDVHDLAGIRLLLEVGSLPMVLERATPDHIEHLKELNRKREKPAEKKDVWNSWYRNMEFHLYLLEIANNPYVLDTVRRILSSCTRAYAQLYALNRETVIFPDDETHAHPLITKAIEERELETAESLLRADILRMESQLLSMKLL